MRHKIIGSVIVATGVLLILALFSIKFVVPSKKDDLLARASQSLGRKIFASRVDVSLWPPAALLTDVIVTNDLTDSASELLRAQRMQVELRSVALLVGRLEPHKIVLQSPTVTIVGDDRQPSSKAERRRSKKDRRNAGLEETARPAATAPQSSAPALFALAPLEISNGTLRHQSAQNGSELLASQIQLRIAGENSERPFDIELEAAVVADQINLRLKGRFGPVAGGIRDYRDIPMDAALQVEALDLGKLHRVMPELKRSLPRILQFDGVYTTKDLTLKGSLNNPSIKGTIKGSDASVTFE